MKPYKIPCPDCGASLRIPDASHVGRHAKCPKCVSIVKVTAPPDDEFLSDYSMDDFEDLPLEPEPNNPAGVLKRIKPKKRRNPNHDRLLKQGAAAIAFVVLLFVGVQFARPLMKAGSVTGASEPSAPLAMDSNPPASPTAAPQSAAPVQVDQAPLVPDLQVVPPMPQVAAGPSPPPVANLNPVANSTPSVVPAPAPAPPPTPPSGRSKWGAF